MRDPGVIDALDALERFARAFDDISDEAGARYSAAAFVRWVKLEVRPPDRMLTECSQNPGNGTGAIGTAILSDRPIHAQNGKRRDAQGRRGNVRGRLRT